MNDVVVGVEALSEYPVVIVVGNEVDYAKLLADFFNPSVNDHILASKLDPIVA